MALTDTPYLAMALNNAWSNATFYGAVRTLPAEAFTAPRPGFFGSLARTLNHILQADLFFLDALEEGGVGRAVFATDDITDPAQLAQQQSGADMRLAGFCNGISAETLGATRQVARPGGVVSERVDALLLQLFQHQIHHRGQAHTQLHHAGVAPPQLDEFYLRCNRAPSAEAYWG